MRISDWSSDVCSSDLAAGVELLGRRAARHDRGAYPRDPVGLCRQYLQRLGFPARQVLAGLSAGNDRPAGASAQRCGRGDRKSVVSGKSVSVRVDLGGRRSIKKKKNNKKQKKTK